MFNWKKGRLVGLFLWAVCNAFLVSGCSAPNLVRVSTPTTTEVPPRIDKIVDLGGLPLVEGGKISQEHSDEIITPGEWLAILGQGLATQETTVTLGGTSLKVAGFLEGGSILARAPRGLSSRRVHELQVTTPYGSATRAVDMTHYIVINDISDDRLRFYQTTVAPKQAFVRDEEQIDFRRVRGHVFSPDGAFLYVIQSSGSESPEEGLSEYLLLTIHMGAESRPEIVQQLPLRLLQPPVDIALGRSGQRLVVLTGAELIVLDARSPLRPEVVSSLPLGLPEGRQNQAFRSLELLEDGRWAVLLEVLNNEIFLVDLENPFVPVLAWRERVTDAQHPSVIDIAADPTDNGRFWLLEGTNVRSIFAKGRKLLRLSESEGGKALGKDEVSARVVRCSVTETALVREEPRALPPAFLPLYMLPEEGGSVLVSGVTASLMAFAEIGLSTDIVKKGIRALIDTAQLGRIVRVTAEGELETTAQGMAIFCSLSLLPGEPTPLYSAMRLGPKLMPPFVKGEWVIEALKVDRLGFRNIRWSTLLPPYIAPEISVQ